MSNMQTGNYGEELSTRYLKKKGYAILERNFSCMYGEIDIIANYENTICFIEVKTRNSLYYGLPNAAVNIGKQKRISKTALFYLQDNWEKEYGLRMDIIEVVICKNGRRLIRHIENAFEFVQDGE